MHATTASAVSSEALRRAPSSHHQLGLSLLSPSTYTQRHCSDTSRSIHHSTLSLVRRTVRAMSSACALIDTGAQAARNHLDAATAVASASHQDDAAATQRVTQDDIDYLRNSGDARLESMADRLSSALGPKFALDKLLEDGDAAQNGTGRRLNECDAAKLKASFTGTLAVEELARASVATFPVKPPDRPPTRSSRASSCCPLRS